jgi:phosphatidylserine decarboxylase
MHMVRDGIYYLLGFSTAGILISGTLGIAYAIPLFLIAAFCAWFFRDPERLLPAGPFALSPADGKVVGVAPEPGGVTRISIFLNVFDVHVNRTPISGIITDITYKHGQFLVASKENASADNEQNIITVLAPDGSVVVFSQIAGLIARRIICYKKVGDHVQAGDRIGLIKFGSRCDVILGPEWQITVKPGMRVSAGSSVLATRPGQVAWSKSLEEMAGELGKDPSKEPALC